MNNFVFMKMPLKLEKLLDYLVISIFVSLPLSVPLNSILIIITCLLSLHLMIINKNWAFQKGTIILPLFFILFLLSLFWTNNLDGGISKLEQRLSFLVVPIFLYSAMRSKILYKKILISWVVIIVILTAVCLSVAFFQIIEHDSTYFINSNGDRQFYLFYVSLVSIIGIDPLYFSLYVSLSILILIHYLVAPQPETKPLTKWLIIALVLYLLIFSVLLSSRGGLMALAGSVLITSVWLKPKYRLLITMSFILGLSTLIILSPYTKSKINTMIVTIIKGYDNKEIHSANMRILNWKVALVAIQETLPLGSGAGSEEQVLKKVYKQKGFNYYFNAHSTFLQTTLSLGIIGLLYLLIFLLSQFSFFYKKNIILGCSFLLLLGFSFVTESVLSRQKGIVFFSLFYTLFFAQSSDE